MIILLHGANGLGLSRRLAELKAEADGGTDMLSTNLTTIEGRDASPADILGPARTPPFLSPRRMVIVDGLLHRFEPRGGRPARSAEPFEPLAKAFENDEVPPTTTLVFQDGELSRGNTLHRRLAKIARVLDEPYPEPKGAELLRFIREEAHARGITLRGGPFKVESPFDPETRRISDPAELLAQLVRHEDPPDSNNWHADTLGIVNELDKLALFTMGREATVDTVYLVCSGARHTTNFAFADALMDGNLGRALDSLGLLLRDGGAAQALIGLLITRYRQLGPLIDMIEDGATAEEMGAALGNVGKFPNLRDAAIARGRRHGRNGLRAALSAIVAADRAMKGEFANENDLEMELLAMKLTKLGRGA